MYIVLNGSLVFSITIFNSVKLKNYTFDQKQKLHASGSRDIYFKI